MSNACKRCECVTGSVCNAVLNIGVFRSHAFATMVPNVQFYLREQTFMLSDEFFEGNLKMCKFLAPQTNLLNTLYVRPIVYIQSFTKVNTVLFYRM